MMPHLPSLVCESVPLDTERVKARTIQRYWRGYKARKRALIMMVHKKVNAVYARREVKEKSAIRIQKVYRGHRRRYVDDCVVLSLFCRRPHFFVVM